jgi:hypothetical protein
VVRVVRAAALAAAVAYAARMAPVDGAVLVVVAEVAAIATD